MELTATDCFHCQKCKWVQKHIKQIKEWKIHQNLINLMMWYNLQFEKSPTSVDWKLHGCAVTEAFADCYQECNIGTDDFSIWIKTDVLMFLSFSNFYWVPITLSTIPDKQRQSSSNLIYHLYVSYAYSLLYWSHRLSPWRESNNNCRSNESNQDHIFSL